MTMTQKEFSLLGHICPFRQYPAPVVPVILKNNKQYAVYLDSNSMISEDNDILEVITDLKILKTYIEYNDNCINKNKLGLFNYKKDKLFAFSESIIESYKAREESIYFRKLLDDESFSADNPFFRLSFAESIEDFDKIEKEVLRCCDDLQGYAPEFIPGWYKNKIKQLSELYTKNITSRVSPATSKKGYLIYQLNSSYDNPFGRALLAEATGERDFLNKEWEDYKKYLQENKPDWLQDEVLETLKKKQESENLESNTRLKLNEQLSPSVVTYQLISQIESSLHPQQTQTLGIMRSSLKGSQVTGSPVPRLSSLEETREAIIAAPSPEIMQKKLYS